MLEFELSFFNFWLFILELCCDYQLNCYMEQAFSWCFLHVLYQEKHLIYRLYSSEQITSIWHSGTVFRKTLSQSAGCFCLGCQLNIFLNANRKKIHGVCDKVIIINFYKSFVKFYKLHFKSQLCGKWSMFNAINQKEIDL